MRRSPLRRCGLNGQATSLAPQRNSCRPASLIVVVACPVLLSSRRHQRRLAARGRNVEHGLDPSRLTAFAFLAGDRRWTESLSKENDLAQTSCCPGVARAIFAISEAPQNAETRLISGFPSYSKGRIRTCDLRVMSPGLGPRWATWGTVSSGFREIEIGRDWLGSVGRVAPFVAPAAEVRPRPPVSAHPLTDAGCVAERDREISPARC